MHYNLIGDIHNIKANVIDTTLSNPGEAADAAATGEAIKGAEAKLSDHEANKENPHGVTKAQVGLGEADNTADIDKPVSNAQAAAIAEAKNEAVMLAEAAAETVEIKALLKTGGTMTGAVTLNGIFLTPGEDFGDEWPENPPDNKLFFKKVT